MSKVKRTWENSLFYATFLWLFSTAVDCPRETGISKKNKNVSSWRYVRVSEKNKCAGLRRILVRMQGASASAY